MKDILLVPKGYNNCVYNFVRHLKDLSAYIFTMCTRFVETCVKCAIENVDNLRANMDSL